ncbi:MAG TPA: TonB-dependent receptor [Nevskiaceae bacterium]|nr:TonB-dependent receptor [Nevskiaceae bacterium]
MVPDSRRRWTLAALLLAAPLVPAHAQDDVHDPVPVAPASETPPVEAPPETVRPTEGEIVVTARGRGESLLDIPISVSTIDAAKFEDAGVKNLSDVAKLVPNLYMDQQATGQRVSIRGIGNDALSASFNSSAGLSIDGLYFGRLRWFEVGLFDVEQVEVLRGPQGVYFGKNTTAGLVNIRSRSPGDSAEANLRAGYTPFLDEKIVEAGTSLPVGDTLRLRLAGQGRFADGYIDNVALDREDPGTRQGIGRFTLDWQPLDALRLESKTQYAQTRIDGQTQQLLACTAVFRTLLAANNSPEDCELDDRRTEGEYVPGGYIDKGNKGEFYDSRGFSESLSGAYTTESWTFSSVTGYHELDVDYTVDPDFSDIPIGFTERPEVFRQVSEELRFETKRDDWWNLLLGAYYDDTRLKADAIVDLNGGAAAAGAGGDALGDLLRQLAAAGAVGGSSYKTLVQDSHSYALFGEVRLQLATDLELDLGGRFTHDASKGHLTQELGGLGNPFDDDLRGEIFFAAIQWSAIDGRAKRSSDNFSPSVIGRWSYSDTGRLYASWVRGFKSGGFDIDVVSQPAGASTIPGFEFGDERVQSFEIGVKDSFFERRLQLSSALYYTRYEDLQVQTTYGFLQVKTLNAPVARATGLELDARWLVDEHWTASLSTALSRSRFVEFENGPCYSGQSAAQGCTDDSQDLSDERLALAPDFSGSAGITWRRELTALGILTVGTDVGYRDDVILSVNHNPLARTGPLTLWNAFVGIGSSDGTWNASVTGANLLDRRKQNGYLDVTLLAGNGGGTLTDPRTLLFQLRFNW